LKTPVLLDFHDRQSRISTARPVLPHVVTQPPQHQTIYMLFYRGAQRVY